MKLQYLLSMVKIRDFFKYIVFSFIILINYVQAQDTIILHESPESLLNRRIGSVEKVGEDYYINNKLSDSISYYNKILLADSLEYIFPNNYCIFIVNGKKIEEGFYFWGNFMAGYYRQYYPNGIIKMEGELNSEGLKIGQWIYYNRKGEKKWKRNYKKSRWFRYPISPNEKKWW